MVDALTAHLAKHVGTEANPWVFPDVERGRPLHGLCWSRDFHAACEAVGLSEGFHFHEVRHTGNTLAAATRASLRELSTRMGDASARAALIHQHATEDRYKAIANALGKLWEAGAAEDAPTNIRKLTRKAG